jgi:Fe-S-cluster-containing hydrogenase component 2
MQKMLLVDQEKCTGCRACEAVCSAKHEGATNPMRSRVKVVKWEWDGFMMPFTCQQCEDAPCLVSCPVKALSREEKLGRVVHNSERCIGCRLCVTVCPFGGMGFDPIGKKVIKCDFCDGDPVCARFCSTQAIKFVDASVVDMQKKKALAGKLLETLRSYRFAGHEI